MSDSNDLPMIIMDDSADAGVGGADPNTLVIFVQELLETVSNLERTLLELEKETASAEKINTAFRLFHNLKGSSAMMGFGLLKDVCHYSESLLDRIRAGAATLQTAHIDLFMEALTAVRSVGEHVGTSGNEGKERYFLLLHKLDDATRQATGGDGASESAGGESVAAGEGKEGAAHGEKRHAEDEVIKVNREHIETLMLLVGDYITLKNRALWLKRKYADRQFIDLTQELEVFAQKLQRNVLKLRLSSVGPVFNSMRRVVRTTAQQLGKKVDFDLEGTDTLLDRSILDVISEPLMHMIRNSIDHGIEAPARRSERNKPETGKLVLKADYRGGEVHVSITDDGNGVDPERIRRKALEVGLIKETQAASMSRQEIIQIIFMPGFSGAEKVTETSGRGVGMDVVKATVQSVGGEIDVQTEVGVGTTITLRLPLSMSFIDSLSFEVTGQAYAVPQVNVEEVYSLHSFAVRENLTTLPGGGKSLVVREVPLPVVSLANIFGDSAGEPESLIQLKHGKRRFVVEVGRILGPTSILSQPLPSSFAEDAPFSGITTRGDGSLLFQLDIEKIARHVHNYAVTRRKTHSENRGTAGTQQEGALMTSSEVRRLQQKIITFRCHQSFCIPVQRAKRIVWLQEDQIRALGDGRSHYVTLDNETVRLIWIEKLLLASQPIAARSYSLILFQHEQVTYGIPTADFKGIKRMPETYDTTLAEPGVLGSTVIDGDTLLLLDLPTLIRLEYKQPLDSTKASGDAANRPRRILAAEDDKFFASELLATLRGNGMEVHLCEDGLVAKNALANPEFAATLDAVVTDIEMPNMTGLSLIRWMKSTDHLRTMPVIAYTAITTAEMKRKVLGLGADDFISKMSFDPLLRRLAALCSGKSHDLQEHDTREALETGVQRLVSIHLGSHVFALPMNNIKEVSPVAHSARIPNAPVSCDRLTFFRGHAIPVLRLSRYLGLPASKDHAAERDEEQAVVEFGGRVFAILVDRVGEVLVESSLTQGEGFPAHTESERAIVALVRQVYRRGDGTIILLDGDRLAEGIFQKSKLEAEEKVA